MMYACFCLANRQITVQNIVLVILKILEAISPSKESMRQPGHPAKGETIRSRPPEKPKEASIRMAETVVNTSGPGNLPAPLWEFVSNRKKKPKRGDTRRDVREVAQEKSAKVL